MKINDTQAPAVTSRQLLYLNYGGKKSYLREAKFSILSALYHRKLNEDFAIRVLTDAPEDFRNWPVDIISLDSATLLDWKGVHGYVHRSKACAIEHGCLLAEKTLFIDSDTIFKRSALPLFEK